MSQAKSAPLGSVAAKVEVVGSRIGWCAPPGPLPFFISFFPEKNGNGRGLGKGGTTAGTTSLDMGQRARWPHEFS